jgi:signal peptidase I
MAAKQPKRFEGARSFIYALLFALLFRSVAYEPFHIPSGSMLNTLQVGDYIFVSKLSYGYSHYSFPFSLDIFDGRLFSTAPKRGDVAVFRLPTNPKIDYIKRVMGLPGDSIAVRNGVVIINGKPVDLARVEDARFADGLGNIASIAQYEETLPNGVKHKILDETHYGEVDHYGPVTVPDGHYFMMGDNRDNSIDSRYGDVVGFVPFENFIGKAQVIAFSYEADASLWKFWQWDKAFRSGRFWQEII